jgi:hypothetical protein
MRTIRSVVASKAHICSLSLTGIYLFRQYIPPEVYIPPCDETHLHERLDHIPRQTRLRRRKLNRDIARLLQPTHDARRVIAKDNILAADIDLPELLLTLLLLLVDGIN